MGGHQCHFPPLLEGSLGQQLTVRQKIAGFPHQKKKFFAHKSFIKDNEKGPGIPIYLLVKVKKIKIFDDGDMTILEHNRGHFCLKAAILGSGPMALVLGNHRYYPRIFSNK